MTYLGVHCPTCKQDCLPNPEGCCGWCLTKVGLKESARHGTCSRYRSGCRCKLCARAYSEYQQAYRRRRAA